MVRRWIVVIGAGHNGLVVAAYLAKAGHRVTVLERSGEVGGILRGAEIAPGFRAPGIAHTVGRLRRSVVDDLRLPDRGLELLEPEVRVFAPQPDGSSVTLWADPARTADELRARNPSDAEAWMPFDRKVRAVAGFLAAVNAARPPDLRGPTPGDMITGARLALAFRRLGGSVGREAIRWMPMAVADLVQEVFEDEAVRGPLTARGVLFTAMGPWSAGSAAVFLNDSAGNDGGAAGTAVFVRGGTERLAAALSDAAREAGAEIRTDAEVVAIRSRNGRIAGVTLADGTGIDAGTVVSAADPRRTLELCDPVELGPSLVWRRGNIRQPGAAAKVNLALSGLPAFHDEPDRLMGRIVIAPSIDYVERASDARKYGAVAEEPWIEATIPTLSDGSLAPEGKHVMSAIVQSAPRSLREGTWADERERLGTLVVKTLERFAPGLGELVEATQVVTPEDLERDYALTGGHVQHAEPGLDQYFAWRPLNGAARYRFVLDGLYLAGSGAHPGGGITGGPGANAARVVRSDARRGRRR
jgi:phytoene dehydrogenase-like protein